MNELQDFLKNYEDATNSHNFDQVEPLIAPNALYWFSDGSFEGRPAIRAAFVATWDKVREEVYSIKNVRWLAVSNEVAACAYTFTWQGIIEGVQKAGEGRGTNVLTKVNGRWMITHEHLSSLKKS